MNVVPGHGIGLASPRLSVGLPVYNGQQYLAESIESVLAQDHDDLELVISDNASTDATADICRTYARRDPRVRYQRSVSNRGAAWNYNQVFRLSRGDYFKWQAADDRCGPGLLRRCAAALDSQPDVVLAHTRTVHIDQGGQPLGTSSFGVSTQLQDPHRRFGALVGGPRDCSPVFGVIRAAVLRRTGLIGGYASSDRVLLAELGLYGPFVELDEGLLFLRHHPQRSVAQYPRRGDRAAWFDPVNAGRLLFPSWRVGQEYLRAVGRAPLTRPERLRCIAQLVPWTWVQRKPLAHDLLSAASWVAARAATPSRRSTGSASTPSWGGSSS